MKETEILETLEDEIRKKEFRRNLCYIMDNVINKGIDKIEYEGLTCTPWRDFNTDYLLSKIEANLMKGIKVLERLKDHEGGVNDFPRDDILESILWSTFLYKHLSILQFCEESED